MFVSLQTERFQIFAYKYLRRSFNKPKYSQGYSKQFSTQCIIGLLKNVVVADINVQWKRLLSEPTLCKVADTNN